MVGGDVLQELRDAHAAYGEAVGKIMQGEGKPETVIVRQPLMDLAGAITDYAIKVVATLDPDDPASLEAIKKALKPLDVVRERASHPGTPEETPEIPPVDPTTPVPEDT